MTSTVQSWCLLCDTYSCPPPVIFITGQLHASRDIYYVTARDIYYVTTTVQPWYLLRDSYTPAVIFITWQLHASRDVSAHGRCAGWGALCFSKLLFALCFSKPLFAICLANPQFLLKDSLLCASLASEVGCAACLTVSAVLNDSLTMWVCMADSVYFVRLPTRRRSHSRVPCGLRCIPISA